MSSKKIFLARGWIFGCASIQGYTHLKIGTTKSHFHGPEFDFPFLMQKLLVINGAIGVLTSHPLAHVWCTWSSLFFPSFKIDWVDFFGTDKHNSPYFCILQCHVLDRKNFCSTSYSSSNSTAKSRPTPNFLSGKNNDFQDVLPPPSFHCLKLTLEFKQVDFSVSAKLISIETPP